MTYVRKDLRPVRLYGISGSKGHGKDTFARLVLEHNPNFKVSHFADDLKRRASRIFGIELSHFNDIDLKDAPLPVPLQLDMFLVSMQVETGLALEPAGCLAKTPREVLQYFGTEYVRKASPDFWVDRALQDRGLRRALIPDTRFLNEAEKIRAKGGFVIEIVRIDAPENTDTHSSETERALLKPDLIVGVRTGDLSLPKRVAILIARGKYTSALRYDYRAAMATIEAYQFGSSLEEASKILGDHSKDPYCLKNILSYYGVPLRKNTSSRIPHVVVGQVTKKQCNHCSELRPLDAFNSNTKSWDALHSVCRDCCSQYNSDKYSKYVRGTLESLLTKSERSASSRGIPFSLTMEQVQTMWDSQEGKCHYSGLAMSLVPGEPNKATFDRKDSSLGYTVDNVVLATYRVNIMKNTMALDDFRAMVHLLATRSDLWYDGTLKVAAVNEILDPGVDASLEAWSKVYQVATTFAGEDDLEPLLDEILDMPCVDDFLRFGKPRNVAAIVAAALRKSDISPHEGDTSSIKSLVAVISDLGYTSTYRRVFLSAAHYAVAKHLFEYLPLCGDGHPGLTHWLGEFLGDFNYDDRAE